MKKKNFPMFVVITTAALFITACIPTTGGVATVPTLSATASASSITTTSATSGGTITSNGGATITASGIVWGTGTNPTVALTTKTTTSPVITVGAFIGNLTSLTSGATYYVRAYATNSVGTGYGPQISFVATTGTGTTSDIPAVFTNHFTSAVTLSTEGNYIVFKSKGIPDHVSPYWQTSNPLYVAPATGHIKNPSYIGEQNFTMKILKTPQAATTQSATNMGPIGMAINGVAIYNNLEAGSIPIQAVTVTTFDTGGGHSGPGDLYHYHCEPTFISSNDNKLIGFLMDGYPIYGRKDMDGSYPSDLDANGGHFGATPDYPGGIYHYHCSNVNYMGTGYYILKSGNYYGVTGTFTY